MHQQDDSFEERNLSDYRRSSIPIRTGSVSSRISTFESLSQQSSFTSQQSYSNTSESSRSKRESNQKFKIAYPQRSLQSDSYGRDTEISWDGMEDYERKEIGFKKNETEDINSKTFGNYQSGVGYPSERTALEKIKLESKEKKLGIKLGFDQARPENSKVNQEDEEGRGKRLILRILEALTAILIGLFAIGAGLLTHPISTPPPAGSLPVYLLSISPFISFAVSIFFSIRHFQSKSTVLPRQKPVDKLIVPLLSGRDEAGQGWFCGIGGRKKKVSKRDGQSINLIVDPFMFTKMPSHNNRRTKRMKRERKRLEEENIKLRAKLGYEEENDSESTVTSESSSEQEEDAVDSRKESRYQNQMRWQRDRQLLKSITISDGILALMWIAVSAYTLLAGESCQPGGFSGYCNYYNSSIALSVFESIFFCTSFILDCLDLKRTKYPHKASNHV